MKILVVFTGGTIGSKSDGKWISPTPSSRYTLIDNYSSHSADHITFDTIGLFSILSENITAFELNSLADHIAANIKKDYDGIIITHGTDTLQYTSSFLSLIMPDVSLPVVLVSANHPLDDEKSNGDDNFFAAVEFIKAKIGAGVYVSYKNSDSMQVDIHSGLNIAMHAESSDSVFSIDGNPYAFFKDHKILLNPKYTPTKKYHELNNSRLCSFSNILVIHSHPGDNFEYSLQGYKAVMIIPYHSGTINTASDNLHLFCKKAQSCQIPIILAATSNSEAYESTMSFDRLGIYVSAGMIPTYMKIWLAISNNIDIISCLFE